MTPTNWHDRPIYDDVLDDARADFARNRSAYPPDDDPPAPHELPDNDDDDRRR